MDPICHGRLSSSEGGEFVGPRRRIAEREGHSIRFGKMEFPLGQGHGVIRTLSVQAKTGVVLVGGGERAIAFYPMPVEKKTL